ncbi:hypothetical protein HHK36_020688 [Tetracentron sinense]|uniref:Uncharacterized protein n=1 Tax=Tetracentron sinense TaxID=13715 RepID=A0A834YVJ2_TETSI|nr:hypothetical protein HHK36_020688 [Tetracentron sinense]
MATDEKVEDGKGVMWDDQSVPLVGQEKGRQQLQSNNGRLWMVLLSTFVAVSGSFEFGSCYLVSGSILTIGAITTHEWANCRFHWPEMGRYRGKYSNEIIQLKNLACPSLVFFFSFLFLRKQAMRMSSIVCIIGWLAVD